MRIQDFLWLVRVIIASDMVLGTWVTCRGNWTHDSVVLNRCESLLQWRDRVTGAWTTCRGGCTHGGIMLHLSRNGRCARTRRLLMR